MRLPYIPPVAESVQLNLTDRILDFSQGGPIVVPSSSDDDYEDYLY